MSAEPQKASAHFSALPSWAQIFVVFAGYWLAAKLALMLHPVGGFAAVVWPPSGLAVVTLFFFGRRVWPGIFVGALCANIDVGAPVGAALGIACGNSLEALAVVTALRRVMGPRQSLETTRDIFVLLLAGGLVGPAISASIGVTSLMLSGTIPAGIWTEVWSAWLTGDLLAILVIVPVFLSLPEARGVRVGPVSEKTLFWASLIFVTGIAHFGVWLPDRGFLAMRYLLFPHLMWAALRFGPRSSAWAVFWVAVVSSTQTVLKILNPEPTHLLPHLQIILAQVFLGVYSVTSMVVSVVVNQRNHMERVLHESEGRFRVTANHAPVMIWMCGPDKRCNFLNEGWLEFTGRALVDGLGEGWKKSVHADDLTHYMETFGGAFKAQEDFRMEYRLRRADGEYRWVLDRGTPRHHSDGGFEGFIGSCIDITDRKLLEEALLDRTRELERSNHDLEQFAYVASHDLQEPLRTMESYLDLISEKCRGKLDPKAERWLNHALDGAARMQSIVKDLLVYAKADANKDLFRLVDTSNILKSAISNLHVAIKESKAVVTHDKLPMVNGDATQLLLVFQNLLGNAIKFNKGKAPTVHIGCALKNDLWTFAFADNGIGIDAEFTERIFGVFQRLHSRSEFPGSGIGLAICRKIIDLHGGRIWADSRPGQGATFYFTLPKARFIEEQQLSA